MCLSSVTLAVNVALIQPFSCPLCLRVMVQRYHCWYPIRYTRCHALVTGFHQNDKFVVEEEGMHGVRRYMYTFLQVPAEGGQKGAKMARCVCCGCVCVCV